MNLILFKIKKYSLALLLGATAAGMVSCNKWTEAEPLKIASPDIEEQNPALYAKYLEDLRAYKTSPHTINMGWFNNSKKTPSSQGDHFSKVPDSLDYIVLESPVDLVDREVGEMNDLLNKKGSKVIFEIDFNQIKTAYAKKEINTVTFQNFLTDTVSSILLAVDKFPYQGLVLSYMGKEQMHLTPEEKEQLEAEENIFFQMLNPWLTKNTGKSLFFKGSPQNLINKDILKRASYIVLPTENAVDSGGLSYTLLSATVDGIPTDKFIVLASMTSYKADEAKLGYFQNGSRSSIATARWAAAVQNGIHIAGIGYKNLAYDYFNVLKSYQYSREAIQITNPAIKVK